MTITTRRLKNKDGTVQHFLVIIDNGRDCMYPLPHYAMSGSDVKYELRKIEHHLRKWIDGDSESW